MLIQTREQFEAARTALIQAPKFALDTETTGLHYHLGDYLIGLSTYCPLPGNEDYGLTFYFPFRHSPKSMNLFTVSENLPIEWLEEIGRVFTMDSTKTIIFHNAKFDLKILRAEGIDITFPVKDTMMMSHMVDENRKHSLDSLAFTVLDDDDHEYKKETKKHIKKMGGWEKVSPQELSDYACKDAKVTYDLERELQAALDQQELTPLWPREAVFLHELKELEWEGIEVDLEMAEHHSKAARLRMREIEDELGFDPMKLDVLAHNLYATPPEGLGLLPRALTDTLTQEFPNGRPVMDERVLSSYRNPLCDLVLEYRGLVKANSTWWKGFPEKADKSGRIHPSYNTNPKGKGESFGTRTGRLSSSFPNIQQMPRDPNTPVRKLLLPPAGFSMVEFDYSQVELRIAASYTQDEMYIEAFRNGDDPHQLTADAIGVSRQTAKHAAYTICYGGGRDTLKETFERLEYQTTGRLIDFPVEQAGQIQSDFYRVHPGFRTLAKQAETVARQMGFVRLWTGRRRHFDTSEPWTHRKAFNSIIQGGAAEIIKDAMLRFSSIYRHWETDPHPRMVLQVHDSLWFEIPHERYDFWCEFTCDIMSDVDGWPVPFPVDVKKIRDRDDQLVAA